MLAWSGWRGLVILGLVWQCLLKGALGFCETFKQACLITQLGLPVNNGNEILLANRGSYYLSLATSASTPKTLQLVASILFGRVEFFVRFGENNEPSSTSFDFSSALTGMPDFLSFVSSCAFSPVSSQALIYSTNITAPYSNSLHLLPL